MEDLQIACASTLFFAILFLIVFGFFAYMRYLRYKELTVLAEKGLLPLQPKEPGKGTLRWGIVITALGIALCLGLYPLGFWIAPGQIPFNFGPWMLIGLIPTFFGLALVLIYVLTARRDGEVESEPQQEE